MLRSRVNIDDLMEELRKEGYFSLSDVDTVILETGGNISVIPSKEASPVTCGDIGVDIKQQKISYIYIADGKIRKSELLRSGKNHKWLKKEIAKAGISKAEDVFVLSEDGAGNVFVQRKVKSK